ncbi:hypothetical protein B0J14DRAFT_604546 [Halenospora varia]|nr:hypothetical protein B0J14DRAFT_604546 [Halenospora varia]
MGTQTRSGKRQESLHATQLNGQQAGIRAKSRKKKAIFGKRRSKKKSKIVDVPPDPEFHKFGLLPPEIRDAIWDLALPGPRVLNLHMHVKDRPARPLLDTPQVDEIVWISFTASLLPSLGRIKLPWSQAKLDPFEKAPRGPVLLEVCRESRNVALRRYELAFPGQLLLPEQSKKLRKEVKNEMDRYGMLEKRIWIDFDRDVVFLDLETGRRRHRLNYASDGPVLPGFFKELVKYGSYEVNKIRRLAITSMGGWLPDQPPRSEWYFSMLELMSFASLQEFLLYDDVEEISKSEKPFCATSRRATCRYDRDLVKKIFMEDLERAKTTEERWTADLPLLRVMRSSDCL